MLNWLATLARVTGNAIEESACPATVLAEIDWIIAHDTVVRPDLTVVCGPPPERHVEEPPGLVVEILSAATRDRDETFKKELYQREGVPWYLIVDPDANELAALRISDAGQYESVSYNEILEVDICESCSLKVRVGNLFR